MQALTMFMGECLCLILFFFRKTRNVDTTLPCPPNRVFMIPALADVCSSILQYAGLALISGSTYLMFKGAAIVTTAIFSRVLLKTVLKRHHIIGCVLAIAGVTVVGASGLFAPDSQSTNFSKEYIGYILMITSLIFNGFFYAYEQLLLKKYAIDPMQMVGMEGIFGLTFMAIITLILSLIPCGLSSEHCVYDTYSHAYFQRVDVFFSEVVSDWILLALIILGIVTIAIYNLNGVRITKLFDALTRSLLNITKTTVVWLVGIVLTLIIADPAYQLESLSLVVNLVKAVGFVVIIFATLIYNQLIFREKVPLEESLLSNESIQ